MAKQITKEMVQVVLDAMAKGIAEKGAPNKHLTIEQIEVIMMDNEVNFFVPTRNVINALIKKGYVRYFKSERSGRYTYGFTKKVQLHYFPDKAQQIERNPMPNMDSSADEYMNHLFGEASSM